MYSCHNCPSTECSTSACSSDKYHSANTLGCTSCLRFRGKLRISLKSVTSGGQSPMRHRVQPLDVYAFSLGTPTYDGKSSPLRINTRFPRVDIDEKRAIFTVSGFDANRKRLITTGAHRVTATCAFVLKFDGAQHQAQHKGEACPEAGYRATKGRPRAAEGPKGATGLQNAGVGGEPMGQSTLVQVAPNDDSSQRFTSARCAPMVIEILAKPRRRLGGFRVPNGQRACLGRVRKRTWRG